MKEPAYSHMNRPFLDRLESLSYNINDIDEVQNGEFVFNITRVSKCNDTEVCRIIKEINYSEFSDSKINIGKSFFINKVNADFIFDDDFSFDNISFRFFFWNQPAKLRTVKKLTFNNCIFNNPLKIKSPIITKEIEFEECIFKKTVQLGGSYNSLSFNNCTFHNDIISTNLINKDSISFDNSTFNRDVIFQDCILKNLSLKNCTVGEKENNSLTHSVFAFKNSEKNNNSPLMHIENAIHIAVFSDTTFNSKVNFRNVNFNGKTEFVNTKFNNLVDFYKSTFTEPQEFFKTDFLDRAFIGNVTFKGGVKFIYNRVDADTVISFESSTINNGIDISRANFLCPIQFWGIKGFENQKINNVIKNPLFKSEDDTDIDVCKRIRESFRCIKNSFRKEGNNIEALAFQKLEMKFYEYELKEKKAEKDKGILKTISIYTDIIILKCNKYSNNYGTSWFRGFMFTIILSIAFYLVFLCFFWDQLFFKWEHTGQWIKHWLEFLNITKLNTKPFGCKENSWSYVILFIAKIFIGYGYYQTAQAFRKFGKN